MPNSNGRRSPGPDAKAVAEKLLERLSASPEKWFDERALFDLEGNSKPGPVLKKALKQLLSDERVIHGGSISRRKVYRYSDGRDPSVMLRELYAEAIRGLAPGFSLRPGSENGLQAKLPKLPTRVLAWHATVLKDLAASGEILRLKHGSSPLFLFRRDIEAELARVRPSVPSSGPVATIASHSPVLSVPDRVRHAYGELRAERGLRNVSISSLLDRTGLSRDELHAFLLDECSAHRANPTLGEPTAATVHENDVALIIDGRPHLYVELLSMEGKHD